MTDYNSEGKEIDLKKIEKIRTKEEFYDENGGTVLANYSNISSYPEIQTLSVHDKGGINCVTADRKDTEVLYQKEHPFKCRKFSVPFNVINPLTQCNICKSQLEYVDGIHQFVDYYAHLFHKPAGWIQTKNQYHCPICSLYFVQTQRKFLFLTGSYYVMNTSLISNKFIIDSPVYRRPNIPLYYVELSEEERKKTWRGYTTERSVDWDGNCLVCSKQTFCFSEDGVGCVTGKSSRYGDYLCPHCNLLHHAEEHDD